MKAMILAAGKAERMRGTFEGKHKSLLCVNGKPLIVRMAEALTAARISPLVVNLCHQAEAIETELGDGSRFGNTILYSREETALETAGGIANARSLLGNRPFLVVNSDIHTEIDLAVLVKSARTAMKKRATLAHLALAANPEHNPGGDFNLENGLVIRPEGRRSLTYTGIGMFDPRVFAGVEDGEVVRLLDVLKPLVRQEAVGGETTKEFWSDVGTPERYKQLIHSIGDAAN